MDWKNFDRTNHSIGQNCYHLIWTPKYRYPLFRYPNWARLMEQILRDVAKRHRMNLHEVTVESDHVHCFIGMPCTMSVSEAQRLLKGASAYEYRKRKMIRQYKALWSRGTFYRSIGSTTTEAVYHYINDSHHIRKIPRNQQRLDEGRTQPRSG